MVASSFSVYNLTWACEILRLDAESHWTIFHRLPACHQFVVDGVSVVQVSWCLPSRWEQVCRMWAGVCSSMPHSQDPMIFMYILKPQCLVLRRNIVVCFRLLIWWMWPCSGLYPSWFLSQSGLNFSFSSTWASQYEVIGVSFLVYMVEKKGYWEREREREREDLYIVLYFLFFSKCSECILMKCSECFLVLCYDLERAVSSV